MNTAVMTGSGQVCVLDVHVFYGDTGPPVKRGKWQVCVCVCVWRLDRCTNTCSTHVMLRDSCTVGAISETSEQQGFNVVQTHVPRILWTTKHPSADLACVALT